MQKNYFRRFFSIPSKTNAAAPRRMEKNIKHNWYSWQAITAPFKISYDLQNHQGLPEVARPWPQCTFLVRKSGGLIPN